jgi:sialate O-acetylesterase
MNKITNLFIIVLLCGIATQLEAKIKLSTVFGNHMVLQQRANVTFKGYTDANKRVKVTVGWNTKKYAVAANASGYFEITVPTPESVEKPYEISFNDGEELLLKNVLIGEVWFCSGQSNMEMPVKGFRGQPVFGTLKHIVTANPNRKIRLYTVKRAWNTTPQAEGIVGEWKELSSKDVAEFSATAYFFGDMLEQSLGSPIGLVNCSWSMSKIETWMDKESLANIGGVQFPDINQKEFEWPAGTPTLLWNAMVNPWKGFPVKGVIWYQGEANTANPALYKQLFAAMTKQWRGFFENPEMPFYYVQLAPWQSGGKDLMDWAYFRQAQLELMNEIPNVGMAITADLGSEVFIHPPHKIEVGQRLAYWALAKTYGKEGFQYSGPIFKSAILKDATVELVFDFGKDGLNPENEKIKGFEIAGKDGIFKVAEALIINGSDRVKVWCEQVKEPVEVRYCFNNYKIGNLYNNAGLPAAPFRTLISK